jgi:hypothetical protein
MSTATKAQALPAPLHRKAVLGLAGAILATAVIVVLALSITGSEAEKTQPTKGPAHAAAGQRIDGGPEGRIPGMSAAQPPSPEHQDGGLGDAGGPTPFSGPR